MSYLPTRTGMPAVDRNFREISDAIASLGTGATPTIAISSTSTVITAGSAVVNWGIQTGIGATGVTVSFATTFSNMNYVPALRAYTATESDIGVTIEKLSVSQMKLTPIGKTGVTIEWSAIGS